MSDLDALLFANEAFYRAFADHDMAQLDALWVRDAPVSCIHPGWPALTERDAIMTSFQNIIDGPAPPMIETIGFLPHIHGDIGIVICYEIIDGQTLVATNIFKRHKTIWLMLHHQAGPSQELPDLETEDSTPDAIN